MKAIDQRILLCLMILVFFNFGGKALDIEPVKTGITQDKDLSDYFYLKEEVKKNPNDPSMQIDFAEVNQSIGRKKQAALILDDVIAKSYQIPPTVTAEAHRTRGHLYLNLGEDTNTAEEIHILDTTYKWERPTFELKAHYWIRKGKYAKAIGVYKEEIVNPTCTDPFIGLANCYRILGKTEKAIQTLKTAHRFDPNCPLVLFVYARILSKQGRFKEARKKIEQILTCEDKPDYFEYHWSLGNLERQRGNYNKSAIQLEKSLHFKKADLDLVYAELGEIYLFIAQEKASDKLNRLPSIIAVAALALWLPVTFYFYTKTKASRAGKVILVVSGLMFVAASIIFYLAVHRYSHRTCKWFAPERIHYKRAVDSLSASIRLNPKRKKVYILLSKALAGAGFPHRAERIKKEAAAMRDDLPDEQMRFIYP